MIEFAFTKVHKDMRWIDEKVRIRVPSNLVLDEGLKFRIVTALYPDALVYKTKGVVFVEEQPYILLREKA